MDEGGVVEVMCKAFCFGDGCDECEDEGRCYDWPSYIEDMIRALEARANLLIVPTTTEELADMDLSDDEILRMIG